MQGVIDLALWRRKRDAGEGLDARLQDAVERLDRVLAQREWDRPPEWLVTELLAVQGCMSMGLAAEAAWRVERLIRRAERRGRRAR